MISHCAEWNGSAGVESVQWRDPIIIALEWRESRDTHICGCAGVCALCGRAWAVRVYNCSIPPNSLLNVTFKPHKHPSIALECCVCVCVYTYGSVCVASLSRDELCVHSLCDVVMDSKSVKRYQRPGWIHFQMRLNWNSFFIYVSALMLNWLNWK